MFETISPFETVCSKCGWSYDSYLLECPKCLSKSTELGEMMKKVKINALDFQVSGTHYKKYKIQPTEYCQANKIPWCESNVIKYISRHKDKNGIEDLRKAKHYIELLAQLDYPDEVL